MNNAKRVDSHNSFDNLLEPFRLKFRTNSILLTIVGKVAMLIIFNIDIFVAAFVSGGALGDPWMKTNSVVNHSFTGDRLSVFVFLTTRSLSDCRPIQTRDLRKLSDNQESRVVWSFNGRRKRSGIVLVNRVKIRGWVTWQEPGISEHIFLDL